MKRQSGIVRLVDELGRIVFPIEMRRAMLINEGTSLEIYTDENRIYLKRYIGQSCFFCEGSNDDLKYFKGKMICSDCLHEAFPDPDPPLVELETAAGEVAAAAYVEETSMEQKKQVNQQSIKLKRPTLQKLTRIEAYLTEHPKASYKELSAALDVTPQRVYQLLKLQDELSKAKNRNRA